MIDEIQMAEDEMLGDDEEQEASLTIEEEDAAHAHIKSEAGGGAT